EDIAAALVELARQPAACDVELEQQMARRELSARGVADVPPRDDQPPRIGIAPNLGEHIRELIDVTTVRRGPAAPLVAVDRAELAARVRPFVPDRHAGLLQR